MKLPNNISSHKSKHFHRYSNAESDRTNNFEAKYNKSVHNTLKEHSSRF